MTLVVPSRVEKFYKIEKCPKSYGKHGLRVPFCKIFPLEGAGTNFMILPLHNKVRNRHSSVERKSYKKFIK